VDVQKCEVQISTRLPDKSIVISAGGGITCGPEVTGEYNLKYQNVTRVLNYTLPAEPHTVAAFTIFLQRDIGPFQNAVIIPCIMLFIIGYSSLYLSAQPARAAFAIITVLAALNVNKAGQELTPVHVGSTWADDWLLLHMSFSFFILLFNVASFHPWVQLRKTDKKKEPQKDSPAKTPSKAATINTDDWVGTIQMYFKRYDIDKSGTIEIEELSQLTVNLLTKLEIDVPLSVMDRSILKLEAAGEVHMSLDEFSNWFIELMGPSCPGSQDSTQPANSSPEEFADCVDKEAAAAAASWHDYFKDTMAVGLLPSSNLVDLFTQRLMPFLYVLSLIIMFVKMGALVQTPPSDAQALPTQCVPQGPWLPDGLMQK